MTRIVLSLLSLAALILSVSGPAGAHCEVPCGVFDDPARFTAMLENTKTIRKAMVQIQDLAGKQDAQSQNQLVRWVNTKEDHAVKTMDIIGQYFMAQRIKPAPADDTGAAHAYGAQLTAAHAVMIAAMKCKQTVDTAQADVLKKAIETFQKLYEGKMTAEEHWGHEHGGGDHEGDGRGNGGHGTHDHDHGTHEHD